MFELEFSSVVKSALKDVVNVIGPRPKTFDLISPIVLGTLAQIPGDYVEIGTWFGCSALVVALVKKRAGIDGSVTCIDPFTGPSPIFYQAYQYAQPSKEQVLANAEKLDVELSIIDKPSNPWPKELEGRAWTMGYIDGDHRYPHPQMDFEDLSHRVTKFLVFDDFSPNHRAVEMVISNALRSDPAWSLSLVYRNCAVLERPTLSQKVITYNIMEWIDPEFDWSNYVKS